MNKSGYKYHNSEILNKYIDLQKEMIERVFGTESEGKGLEDVYQYMEKLNRKKGGVATTQLAVFKKDAAYLPKTIASRRSGCNGEKMMFKSLETIKGRNIVLKNVELSFDGHQTELDALVLTKKGAIIVEAKNTSRDVIITSSGNLKRQRMDGKYDTDCSLGLRMNDKEYVLRKALERSDYKRAPIKSVVVFTNSDIIVDNQNEYIKTCSLSELPHVIGRIVSNSCGVTYSFDEMQNMAYAVEKSRVCLSCKDDKNLKRIKDNFEKILDLISTPTKSIFSRIKNLFCHTRKVAAMF